MAKVQLKNSSSARVERATCRLGGDRSIHLSYEDKEVVYSKLSSPLSQG